MITLVYTVIFGAHVLRYHPPTLFTYDEDCVAAARHAKDEITNLYPTARVSWSCQHNGQVVRS